MWYDFGELDFHRTFYFNILRRCKMSSIFDLSWSKTSFLSKFILFMDANDDVIMRLHSHDCKEKASGYSALSSTYHNIYGTAFAKLKSTVKPWWLLWLAPIRAALWSITWLPLAGWCYMRALPLSNRVVELIGYGGMSADQCDIRQSILFWHNYLEEAKTCINAALVKSPGKAHTRGLLHVGLAKIYRKEGDRLNSETELIVAINIAEEAEKEDPRQAVRIYRHCASIADSLMLEVVSGDHLRRKAKKIAQELNLKDQLLKI